MKLIITSIFAIIVMASSSAFAEAVVVDVKGDVAFKTGNRWQALANGTTLPVGAKVSTGIKSSAVVKFGKHTLTIKPLSVVEILESTLSGSKDSTTIGLKRGGINAKVTKSDKVKTSFKIATPVATSSVRGTQEDVYYGPDNGMKTIPIENTLELEGVNTPPALVFGKLEYEQSPDKGKPESLNSNRQKDFVNDIADNNITDEESDNNAIYGDDKLIGDLDSDINLIDDFYKNTVKTTIQINW